MALKTVKVAVEDLQAGMYVANLDRPWTETPFLFQGFYIRGQEEIDELKKYCESVYIDIERGPAPQESRTGTAWTTARNRADSTVTGFRKQPGKSPAATPRSNRTVYIDSVPMEDELKSARDVHQTVLQTTEDIMAAIRAGHALDMSALKHATDPMVESVLRNPDAMIWLSRMKRVDSYLYSHAVSSAVWAIAFGRHLGLDRSALGELAMGGLLFDVGKIKLPHELLVKPEKLTEEEYELARRHLDYGLEILDNTHHVPPRVLAMVRSHHERYDGSGYREGLKQNQIPTFAKIAGMVDSYDAITSIRPYAKPLSSYDAVREIYKWRNVTFQTEVVEQFIQVVGIFPTGTLVELNNGIVGVVISQNRARRLKPKLMLVLDQDKKPIHQFATIDLLIESENENEIWIEKCLEPGAYGIDSQEFYL